MQEISRGTLTFRFRACSPRLIKGQESDNRRQLARKELVSRQPQRAKESLYFHSFANSVTALLWVWWVLNRESP